MMFILLSIQTFSQYSTLHDFSIHTIDGKSYNLSQLKGKKVLIVNTASECSLDGQIQKLQELYEEYGGEDFEIIAFPSNDFGNHEPGSNEEILEHYNDKYEFSFPLMGKISVKGEDAHPLYQWLTDSEKNGTLDANVLWNFQKFLIDEEGRVIESISPLGSPTKKRIIEWLQEDM
ncbi:MAG: glutathione peroxidase [Prolixibacteraceae bacterium]